MEFSCVQFSMINNHLFEHQTHSLCIRLTTIKWEIDKMLVKSPILISFHIYYLILLTLGPVLPRKHDDFPNAFQSNKQQSPEIMWKQKGKQNKRLITEWIQQKRWSEDVFRMPLNENSHASKVSARSFSLNILLFVYNWIFSIKQGTPLSLVRSGWFSSEISHGIPNEKKNKESHRCW